MNNYLAMTGGGVQLIGSHIHSSRRCSPSTCTMMHFFQALAMGQNRAPLLLSIMCPAFRVGETPSEQRSIECNVSQ